MDTEVFLICVSPLIINIGLVIYLVATISRQRITQSARSLLIMIAAAFLWSFGYSMELISPSLEEKLFWGKFEYFGITILPLAWFSFSFQHLSSRGWSARPLRQRLLLAVLPMITMILVWTNERHGLIWRSIELESLGSFQVLHLEHGPAFWVYLVYSYCLLLIGSVRLISGMFVPFTNSRWRIMMRVFAILIPWFGNLIYVTGLNPIPHFDWSAFCFTIAGVLFSASLYRSLLIDILPIAQKKVFAVIPDCLLVIDMQNHVMDINSAAQKIIANPDSAWQGKPLAQVAPRLAPWVPLAHSRDEFRAEMTQGDEPDKQSYDVRILPLTTPDLRPVGRLIVCHNITQYKQTQAQLEQVRVKLEEAVMERTAELQEAVDQLKFELAQRALAEKRFENIINSAPDALLLIDQGGIIKLVNALAEKLFGYSKDELLECSYERLISAEMRKRHLEYLEQFIHDPSVRQIRFGLTLSALRKDGSEFPVEISLGTVKTWDSFWISCIIRDITERKQTEEKQNQLLVEIKQSHEQLRALATRMSEVQDNEQRMIALELHDRVGQNLTGLNLNLQVIQSLIYKEELDEVQRRLEDSMDLIEETTRQVRNVMAELSPPLLEEYGLGAALRFSCEKFMERTGIETIISGDGLELRLSPRKEIALFRIVQEGLNNVLKHSEATRVEVSFKTNKQTVLLSLVDNGSGFDPQEFLKTDGQPHLGLLSIQERAISIGGRLQVHSVPGQGTCLEISIQQGEPYDKSHSR